jgi:hypothetical protein
VTTALAWSRVRHLPTRAPAGCVSARLSVNSLSSAEAAALGRSSGAAGAPSAPVASGWMFLTCSIE